MTRLLIFTYFETLPMIIPGGFETGSLRLYNKQAKFSSINKN